MRGSRRIAVVKLALNIALAANDGQRANSEINISVVAKIKLKVYSVGDLVNQNDESAREVMCSN